jgi:hypothetical protein
VRSPIAPTTIFTIEAPPQRFSHPLITPLDSILFEKQETNAFPEVIITAPSTKSASTGSVNNEGKRTYPDQHLLHPDSYFTDASLLETIELDLPHIQQGISHIDLPFIKW